MIIEAGFDTARLEGSEAVNIRSVAKRLGCSTQPIMYNFETAGALRRAVYEKASEFHTAFVSEISGEFANPILEIGLRYIRFAAEERFLFRFLFQSEEAESRKFNEFFETERISPLTEKIAAASGISTRSAAELFRMMFLLVHGYACLLADNDMEYDDWQARVMFTGVFIPLLNNAKSKKNIRPRDTAAE